MVMPNSSSPLLVVLCQVSQNHSYVFSLSLLTDYSKLDLMYLEMYFNVYFDLYSRFNMYDCMISYILKCATVIFDLI